MDLSKLINKYEYSNGIWSKKRGPTAGVAIDQKEVIMALVSYGIEAEELSTVLNILSEKCKVDESKKPANIAQMVSDLLNSRDFIENFKIVELNDEIFTYYFNGKKATMIQPGYPGTGEWSNLLLQYKNEEMVDLKNRLAPYLYAKNPWSMSPESAAGIVANGLDFSKREDLKVKLEEQLKPVSLETSDEMSMYKVPYHYIEKPKLSPFMKDFLDRIQDHEYLCAITWILFNGHKSPYLVYLYGTGGEGKSSFLNVLLKKIGAGVAYQGVNQFSNYHMYGKAMILITENTDCFLLQNQIVKQITGNSPVVCEPKGEKAFTSTLTGTVYADANKMLKLKGEEAEFRRLRLFKVKKPSYTIQLDSATYEKRIGEDFIDFLNYCRLCFERIGTPGSWLVPASKSQTEDFKTLTDKGFINASESILRKIFKEQNLEFSEKESIPSDIFWKTFYSLPESKEKFLADNVKDYLFLHKGVSEAGDRMHGILQKTERTTFNIPNIS